MKDPKIADRINALDPVDLDTSWSKEQLWEAIESKMDDQKSNHRFLNIGWKALPWAAMFLFALGVYWFSSNTTSNAIKVVSMEAQVEPIRIIERNDQLIEGKNFIQEACKKELDICSTPSFVILHDELSRIEDEKMLLSETVRQYGADEITTRALIQLENAESSITSQLISMIVI